MKLLCKHLTKIACLILNKKENERCLKVRVQLLSLSVVVVYLKVSP